MKPTDDLTEFKIIWCVAVALATIGLIFGLLNL
jgi:hypothetical protein